jgi:hypothetical protein
MVAEFVKTGLVVTGACVLPASLGAVTHRGWVLFRHGGAGLGACFAAPLVLGSLLGWKLGHPVLGATAGFGAALLALALVRKAFIPFVGGIAFCAVVFSALGAVAGHLVGGGAWHGAFLGLVSALGFGLVELTDGLKRPSGVRPGPTPREGAKRLRV